MDLDVKQVAKGQLNSEWIMMSSFLTLPTKNFKDFCPGSLLEGRAEILKIVDAILGETMTS